jgi:cytochrome c556
MLNRTVAAVGAAFLVAAAAPAALSPDQYVAARQASFDMSAMVAGQLRATAKDGTDVTGMVYAATGLGRWARVLPTLFPAGSGEGDVKVFTQARPAIWSDRATFEAAAARYAAAADKLAGLAKAGDTEGFKAGVTEVSAACNACHAKFKDGPK